MTKDIKTLFSNFLSLSLLKGVQVLIPLLTIPYLVSNLGLEKYGLVAFSLAYCTYFGVIIQFGFSISATKNIALCKNDNIELGRVYSRTLLSAVLLTFFCLILFCFIGNFFSKIKSNFTFHLITFMFVIFQSLNPFWFYQGVEKMKFITVLNLCTTILFVLGIVLFVKHESDYIMVPLFNATSALISLIFSLYLIHERFNVKFRMPPINEVRLVFVEGYHAFLNQLAPNSYKSTAFVLLGMLTTNSIVGVYSIAIKIIDGIVNIAYILSITFLPYLARSQVAHSKFQILMLICGFFFAILIFGTNEYILYALFGTVDDVISSCIMWLSPSIFFSFVYLTYNTNYLMIYGYERIAKNIAVISSLIMLFATYFLILSYGLNGAVASMILGRFTFSALSFVYFRKVMT